MEHTKDPSKDNVILIGMPGVGKSTAGVILAKVLGYDFLDSDLVIQKQTKKRLSEIIAAEGIDGFNTLENRINSEITVSHPTVIATDCRKQEAISNSTRFCTWLFSIK